MVTEVINAPIAITVYLDGGKPGTSGGFNIKEVSLWWRLLTIANCWDRIDIEFSLTRDTILEWVEAEKDYSSCINQGSLEPKMAAI